MITIEFFGVPRLRAGRRSVSVDASTLAAALGELRRVCPALGGSVVVGERIHPAYRLCLNDREFVADPQTQLADGDVLLLLAADVGG